MWARLGAWYRRHAGVRLRSALAAAAVVAVVIAVAAAAFLYLYHRSLLDSLDADARRRADAVAAEPTGTDPTRRASGVIPPERGDLTPVQILGPDGAVVASSPSVRGLPPLTPLRPQPGRTQRENRRLVPGQSDTYRVAALGVARADGTYTVVVGESREAIDDSVEDAGALLLLGCPFLIAVVATATYLFVGRSLAPVEAMRRKVSVVTADRLGERVPVPEARDEVANLAETMNAMLDRLQTQVDARRRFVADAGHELRSPITTLRGGLEVLAARPLAARDSDMVGLLSAEVGRLDHLVDGLLWLARADEHGLHTRHTDVDLDDLVDTERRRLAARHPALRITADMAPTRVYGDAGQLAQVLRNLADNAATHASSAVRLAVAPSADGHTAVLDVADDGLGVPPAERDRIFGRFVRLDPSRDRDSGGVGLGLAIVHQLVAAHHGTVDVGEVPGGGALFRVVLPSEPNHPPSSPHDTTGDS
ncbi:HAMP domain-containing sensor histidine kinase [Embleya sp. NPDC005575]|uniref:sensor histidine kinase n=1 Tax=Embleya sp. NPDC005575 TaxID=3156892 RepID=UPI0033B4C570